MRLAHAFAGLVRDAAKVSLTLYKILIPVIIGVKICTELNLVPYLAAPLAPAMELLGLPGAMGLAWATAMLSNLYAGMAVFVAVLPQTGALTQAQVTVLGVVMLFAHNLIQEGAVTKRCGAGFWTQNAIRFGGAFACGLILHWIFSAGGFLAAPVPVLWTPAQDDSGLFAWALGQAKNLGFIFCVITALMALMRTLTALGLSRFMEAALTPFLRLMGIGAKAATITIIGLTLGIGYGGGLIIHEVDQGAIPRRDVFASVTLMSLCHALIEDTILMTLIGSSPWGTLAARLTFSLAATAVLVRLIPRRAFERL
ncbi:MAG: hypothetical protein HQK81_08895 [Desulfovibrionaceae bacterium]|nr:hypothetical protein [Desulfovibrionaceae bacterium]MBF0514166.1 hypothetical protein [Desulfovibrionaceae bacterium]